MPSKRRTPAHSPASSGLKTRRSIRYRSCSKGTDRSAMAKKPRASNPTMVGAYLRAAREEFGQKLDGVPWKQEDLAELLSVSATTVAHWEQGLQTPKQRELDHVERCRVLIDLGYDPRKIRAESVEDLAARSAEGVQRGFPLGRSRS